MHLDNPVPPREGAAQFVTTVQLAAHAGMTRHAIVYHIRQGHLVAERHGRDWVITEEEAQRFLRSHQRQQGWAAEDSPGQQVGRAVKRHRLRAGWTQPQLAQKAGLSAACVARVERGVDMATLRALAKALNVTVEELAGQEAQSA
jgi:ribosome-binding protein aMBF1 (putative translation factor)